MADLSGVKFNTTGGAICHCVVNNSGKLIGWIDEVFYDVFYIRFADPKNMWSNTKRYRRMSDALAGFGG